MKAFEGLKLYRLQFRATCNCKHYLSLANT